MVTYIFKTNILSKKTNFRRNYGKYKRPAGRRNTK